MYSRTVTARRIAAASSWTPRPEAVANANHASAATPRFHTADVGHHAVEDQSCDQAADGGIGHLAPRVGPDDAQDGPLHPVADEGEVNVLLGRQWLVGGNQHDAPQ